VANSPTNDGHALTDGTARMVNNASRLKEHLTAAGHDISETAKGGVEAAGHQVTRTVDAAKQRAQSAVDRIGREVSDHPWRSLAIAAGAAASVGLLIGLLGLRSRK